MRAYGAAFCLHIRHKSDTNLTPIRHAERCDRNMHQRHRPKHYGRAVSARGTRSEPSCEVQFLLSRRGTGPGRPPGPQRGSSISNPATSVRILEAPADCSAPPIFLCPLNVRVFAAARRREQGGDSCEGRIPPGIAPSYRTDSQCGKPTYGMVVSVVGETACDRVCARPVHFDRLGR
jgi:hypothetical protein